MSSCRINEALGLIASAVLVLVLFLGNSCGDWCDNDCPDCEDPFENLDDNYNICLRICSYEHECVMELYGDTSGCEPCDEGCESFVGRIGGYSDELVDCWLSMDCEDFLDYQQQLDQCDYSFVYFCE